MSVLTAFKFLSLTGGTTPDHGDRDRQEAHDSVGSNQLLR
jgi:hypothetical protein